MDTDNESSSLRSQGGDKTYAIEPGEFMHLQVDNPPEFIKNSPVVGFASRSTQRLWQSSIGLATF